MTCNQLQARTRSPYASLRDTETEDTPIAQIVIIERLFKVFLLVFLASKLKKDVDSGFRLNPFFFRSYHLAGTTNTRYGRSSIVCVQSFGLCVFLFSLYADHVLLVSRFGLKKSDNVVSLR